MELLVVPLLLAQAMINHRKEAGVGHGQVERYASIHYHSPLLELKKGDIVLLNWTLVHVRDKLKRRRYVRTHVSSFKDRKRNIGLPI